MRKKLTLIKVGASVWEREREISYKSGSEIVGRERIISNKLFKKPREKVSISIRNNNERRG